MQHGSGVLDESKYVLLRMVRWFMSSSSDSEGQGIVVLFDLGFFWFGFGWLGVLGVCFHVFFSLLCFVCLFFLSGCLVYCHLVT